MEMCSQNNDEKFTNLHISTGENYKDSIKSIFDLQEKRVHVWNEFDLKFKEYTLDAPDFELKKLQLICKEISDQLNAISTEIIALKETFSQDHSITKAIFKLVEKLQENEQVKFQLVRKFKFLVNI